MVGNREGYAPSRATRGSGAASRAPPAGSGAEPRRLTKFDAIYAAQNACGGRIIGVCIICSVLIKFREMLVSHGGSSSFRSFDLVHPGVAPPLKLGGTVVCVSLFSNLIVICG